MAVLCGKQIGKYITNNMAHFVNEVLKKILSNKIVLQLTKKFVIISEKSLFLVAFFLKLQLTTSVGYNALQK